MSRWWLWLDHCWRNIHPLHKLNRTFFEHWDLHKSNCRGIVYLNFSIPSPNRSPISLQEFSSSYDVIGGLSSLTMVGISLAMPFIGYKKTLLKLSCCYKVYTVGRYLMEKYGEKVICVMGSIALGFGYLGFGLGFKTIAEPAFGYLLIGLGNGCIYSSNMCIIPKYFNKVKPLTERSSRFEEQSKPFRETA